MKPRPSILSLEIAHDAVAGLSAKQKTLPAKLFYDDEGCRLFTAITQLPEYYVTRTERALLEVFVEAMPRSTQARVLVEYGASDEAKASILLARADFSAYVPIDIAQGALAAIVARLTRSQPGIAIYPVVADFLEPLTLPDGVLGLERVGFFPGSTIGNLNIGAAIGLLRQIRKTLGQRSLLIVGVDLLKHESILLPAYNDSQNVTAAFNLNILSRLNREAAGTFDLDLYRHEARWNSAEGRIEMHLVSRKAHSVSVGGVTFEMKDGESIHTENSYKHSTAGFRLLARNAGWHPEAVWSDPAALFSIHLLSC